MSPARPRTSRAGDPDRPGMVHENLVATLQDADRFFKLTTSFRQPGNIYSAISGDYWLVLGGEQNPELDDNSREPRTAVGINKNGRFLYLVVVDGRQPFYSEGATLAELAKILIRHGAHMAMNLDGGGSSTMVMEGDDGQPLVLNSPIDNYIPGRERAVANHLGVHIK